MFKRLGLNLSRFLAGAVMVLFLSAVYLYAFPSPTLVYAAAVLLHAGLGLIAAVCLLRFCIGSGSFLRTHYRVSASSDSLANRGPLGRRSSRSDESSVLEREEFATKQSLSAKFGWILLTLGALLGAALIYFGATRPMLKWL